MRCSWKIAYCGEIWASVPGTPTFNGSDGEAIVRFTNEIMRLWGKYAEKREEIAMASGDVTKRGMKDLKRSLNGESWVYVRLEIKGRKGTGGKHDYMEVNISVSDPNRACKVVVEAGRAMACDLAQIIYVYRKRAPQETHSMIALAQGNDFFEFARKYDEARDAAERKQKAEDERKAREAAQREHDLKIAKMVERTTGVCPNESNGRCLTHLKGCPYFFNGHCEIVSRRKASA